MAARLTPPPGEMRKAWLGLALITLPCIAVSIDMTVLNLAIPRLSAALRPSSTQLLWIADIYGFMLAGLLVTMGSLGDRIGRRRLLLAGAGAFAAASLLAAFSTSAAMLIASRALLGAAGATLAPSTLSLIASMFPGPRQRTVALGVWASGFTIGIGIGPLVGGVLLERFWWGSVFLPAVPVMVLVVAAGPILIPEYRDERAGRLDIVSALQSLTAVLSVIQGLKQGAANGAGLVAATVDRPGPDRRHALRPATARARGPDARPQVVPHPGVPHHGQERPGGAPVSEPGHQGVAGELAQGPPLTGDGDAPARQLDAVQGEFADGLAVDGVHGC